MTKKILVLYPRANDYANIPRLSLPHEFAFEKVLTGYDSLTRHTHNDPIEDYSREHIDHILQHAGDYDAIISSDDYPGSLVASLYAERWGLTFPSVESVLACQHKYYMRQQTVSHIPEATPQLSPYRSSKSSDPSDAFPLFIKPIKSSFSRHAHRVHSPEELQALCSSSFFDPQYLTLFNETFSEYIGHDCDANYLIGESLLEGVQVSLEGYVQQGEVVILGIIDAHMYPGTISFESFTYPSQLPATVQERMGLIAQKAIAALGLDHTLFSIELMYNPLNDRISLIEINPRMSSQFADFFEKVHGQNTYQTVVALALGEVPPHTPGGTSSHAASFPLRLFQDQFVTKKFRAPKISKHARTISFSTDQYSCKEGLKLSELRQDSGSYLYAIINVGAQSFEELEKNRDEIMKLLPFTFLTDALTEHLR